MHSRDNIRIVAFLYSYPYTLLAVSCLHKNFFMYRLLGHLGAQVLVGFLFLPCCILVLASFIPFVRYCCRRVFYPWFTLEDFSQLKYGLIDPDFILDSQVNSTCWVSKLRKFKSEGRVFDIMVSNYKYSFLLNFKKIPMNLGRPFDYEIFIWRLRIGK